MLIQGTWHLCDDGFTRPVFCGEVRASNGRWVQVVFLADVGADRSVFSADILEALQCPPVAPTHQLGGVGGVAHCVLVRSEIVLFRENGSRVAFRGEYAAMTDARALDMSVLGRDITNLFAAIIDRPGDTVCLVGQGHHYVIGPK